MGNLVFTLDQPRYQESKSLHNRPNNTSNVGLFTKPNMYFIQLPTIISICPLPPSLYMQLTAPNMDSTQTLHVDVITCPR